MNPDLSLAWRKSSRSGNGGGNCVETAVTWQKSERSMANGACVEVAKMKRRLAA